MKALLSTGLCILFILLLTPTGFAEVPQMINYQGRLTTPDGEPVNATVDISFALFDAELGGTILWKENHSDIVVTDGLFRVLLGSLSSLTPQLFDGSVIWLAIAVDGGSYMPERVAIVSSAYALRSEEADLAAQSVYADTAGFVSGGQVSGWEIDGNIISLDDDTDSVGVGISSPSARLHVNGNLRLHNDSEVQFGSSAERIYNLNASDLAIESGDDIYIEPEGEILLRSTSGFTWGTFRPNNGTVGFGTPAPEELLHIRNNSSNGEAFLQIETSHASSWNESGLKIKTPQNAWQLWMDDYTNDDISSGALGLRNDNAGNVMTWSQAGEIGVGVTSPDELLHIENDASGGRSFLQVESSHPSNWHEAGLRIKTPQNIWHLRMDDDSNNNLPDGALGLRSQTGVEAMTWAEDGNVGIGTTEPQQRLHVWGSLKVKDTLFANALPEDFVGAENIIDEPGVASNEDISGSGITLTSTPQSIISRSITVPGPGYVMAFGNSTFIIDHGVTEWDFGYLSLSATPDGSDVDYASYVGLNDNVNEGTFQIPISCHRVFPVESGGEYTIHLIGETDVTSSSRIVVTRRQLALIYLPTAYGTVAE